MPDASFTDWTEKERTNERTQEGGRTMTGSWLIWIILGGLFLFLLFRGGGCCGGHSGHGGHRDGVEGSGPGKGGIHPKDH